MACCSQSFSCVSPYMKRYSLSRDTPLSRLRFTIGTPIASTICRRFISVTYSDCMMLQIGVAPADDAQSNFHLLTMTRRDWTLVGHLHS